MALEVGIVGLPGAGTTLLFNALTRAGAQAHDQKEHVGMAPITDERLPRVAAIESSRKVTPAAIRVVDVPGTGPQLLGNLRQVDALLLVVRDPGQLEELRLELLVADRDLIERTLERVRTQAKSGDPQLRKEAVELEHLLAHVDAGGTVADFEGAVPTDLETLTTKPVTRPAWAVARSAGTEWRSGTRLVRTTSHQPRTGATPRVYVRNLACG